MHVVVCLVPRSYTGGLAQGKATGNACLVIVGVSRFSDCGLVGFSRHVCLFVMKGKKQNKKRYTGGRQLVYAVVLC